jgi:parallel beta-helix repeat protein
MRKFIIVSLIMRLATLTTCVANENAISMTETAFSIAAPIKEGNVSVAITPIPITVPALGSRYYYVSTRGNDANAGTRIFPFRTISRAASVAVAGDVVLIQAGTYFEKVNPLHSGEFDRYITYQNAGDGDVVIDAQNGLRAACIEIDGESYLQFIGLIVRGANSSQMWPRAGISMMDGTNHVILKNVTSYNNYFGIMAYGRNHPVSHITIEKSKTFDPIGNIGNSHYGIFFYKRVYDSSIVNSRVAYTLPEDQSYGIEISTDYPGRQSDGPRRIVLSGNEVDHNESQGIHTWNAAGVLIDNNYLHDNGASGIQVEDGSENIVVENNLSENNAQKYEFEAGAWVDDSKNVVVRNNIMRNNKVGLIITKSALVNVHDNFVYFNNRGAENLDNSAGLIVDNSVTDISVTHNTFYKNGASDMERGTVNFGVFHPICRDITFKNNIVAESGNALDLLQDSCLNYISDFNDFYNTRPLVVDWNQSEADWLTYKAVSGQDVHSLTSVPLFTDPSIFDFSLQPASQLIGKGAVLARATMAGSGKTINISEAAFFSDGFGIGGGDLIMIGNSRVNIIDIDYINNFITVDRDISWNKGDAVSFPFSGMSPDMGAYDRKNDNQ